MAANPPPKQHVLVHHTKNEHEYQPDRALEAWRLVQQIIPVDYDGGGWGDREWMSDTDRVVALFELLDGSILGDMVFADLANFDQGCDLIEPAEED